MSLDQAGAFPNEGAARVAWVSVGPAELLDNLKNRIDQAVPKFKDDNPFSPHITLARMHATDLREEVKTISTLMDRKEFLVGKITLFKSTLTMRGAIYERLL